MDNTSPKQMSDAWLIDGSLLYRLNADDANRDEIDVRMVDGSRALGPRTERAWALRDLLRADQEASPLPAAPPINAAAAHGEVAVPQGWKLVPLEPTDEMLRAMESGLGPTVWSCGEASPPCLGDFYDAYTAMLLAAPEHS